MSGTGAQPLRRLESGGDLCVDDDHDTTSMDTASMTAGKATLHDLLANSIILHQIAPYLPVAAIIALASVDSDIRGILATEPEVFRHLDLSPVKSAAVCTEPLDRGGNDWRNQRMDENLTEDEFVSGPLRGIFTKLERQHFLGNVQTLVLDGLGVTAELVHELVSQDRFRVRILSIRGCPTVNERRLMQVLNTAVRPTRPEGQLRLRGLYVFGPKSVQVRARASMSRIQAGVTTSIGAQIGAEWNHKSQHALNSALAQCDDRWYLPNGRQVKHRNASEGTEWAETIEMCHGLIAFDAVLCRGPRHDITRTPRDPDLLNDTYLPPQIAAVALGAGCAQCGSMPEGPAVFGQSPTHQLPLLEPPPLHSSAVPAAQKPHMLGDAKYPSLFLRCEACLRGRWCERCMKWWCEDCYPAAMTGQRINEVSHSASTLASGEAEGIKVLMGLCTEACLVAEMMSGAGSNGMWG